MGVPLVEPDRDTGAGFGPWRLGDDEALTDVVASVNVAYGCPAGDPVRTRVDRGCRRAVHRCTAIGARVGRRGLAGTVGAPGRGSGAW